MGSDKESFLEDLRGLGVVDITRSTKAVDEKSAEMLEDITGLKREIKDIRSGTDQTLRELEQEKQLLSAEKESIEVWGHFDREKLNALGVPVRFYSVSRKNFDPLWKENYPLEIVSGNDSRLWFVVLDSNDFPLTPLSAPSRKLEEVSAAIDLKDLMIRKHKSFLESRLSEIPSLEERMKSMESDLSLYLASVRGKNEAEDKLVVFEGFAPTEEDSALEAAFDGMPCIWLREKACEKDNPPIKLRNNKFVSMFEVLTDMYGRPAYNGFDPTPYISVFFLLFFAMCMGDAGYGLVLMIIGLLLRKVRSFGKLSPLVLTLGAGTFLVGLFFHTFFSTDMMDWECIPNAVKDCMLPASIAGYDGTMILALATGVVHLCLAMIVKTVYATKNNGFLNSLSIWGWTLFLVGCVAVGAFALAGVLDKAAVRLTVIALGCISALGIFFLNDLHRNPLKNVGAGLWETYNTATGVLGDVLSYLRLYALGLAGSMLGFAFNNLGSMVLDNGGVAGWVFFILIVTVGHALNIAMAVLGAFVHPLRLNFLEFFKNSDYQGVGRKYNPLNK